MIRNRTKTLGYLNKLLIKYYNSGKTARQDGRTIAYVSVGFPVELLYAIDILPYFPQNHAAFYGSQGKTADVFGPAEGEGLYSTDLCSEIKATIGMALAGESLSFNLPKPDLIISANNICGSITKCAEALSRYYHVPLFIIDTPFVSSHVNLHSINYVAFMAVSEIMERDCRDVQKHPCSTEQFRWFYTYIAAYYAQGDGGCGQLLSKTKS
jgi:benzoyl-CoA reductase/2-hydroxyglutaryl-CoA dehydratase subunit BcrC/BadD/HgdB